MAATSRVKKRLGFKRQRDQLNAVQQCERTLETRNSDLQAEIKRARLELERVQAAWREHVDRLETIKAFYEERFGSYDELVRAEQAREDANGMNNVTEFGGKSACV